MNIPLRLLLTFLLLPWAHAADYDEVIKIKDDKDREVLSLKRRGDDLKIEIAGKSPEVLRAKKKESGKRKYELEGGGVVCEIKYDGSDFKIRKTDGSLIWKVGIDGNKMKWRRTESGDSPYALKISDSEQVKILVKEQEIGRVKFYGDKVKVKDAKGVTRFESNTSATYPMFGALLFTDIPLRERALIMGELMLHFAKK